MVTLLLFSQILLSLASPFPQNQPYANVTSAITTTPLRPSPISISTCGFANSATLVALPPATATCGIKGGEGPEVIPLNYEQSHNVTSIEACAQQCLAYLENLCKSLAIYITPSGVKQCALLASTVQQLEIQTGIGNDTFYDVGCFGLDCKGGNQISYKVTT